MPPTNHLIDLKPGTPPTASPYGQPVKKGNGGTIKDETIEWKVNGTSDWVVVFADESPFDRRYYDAAHPQTKNILKDPGPTHYHYLVCVNGEIAHSPYVIVS